MISTIVKLGAVASLASSVVAAQSSSDNATVAVWPTSVTDYGNGVHIPGAIPRNLNEPLQHRLAYHGSTGMTISWNTFQQLDQPSVIFGTDPKKLDQMATSDSSTTYETSRTFNNHVKIDGLKSGTKYWYQVSHTNEPGGAYRPTYTFETALSVGDKTPFTVGVFGDLGLMGEQGLTTHSGPLGGPDTFLREGETNTIQSLLESADSYSFLAHTGDIGYADYFLKESIQGFFGTDNSSTQPTREEVAQRYEEMSEQFFDQMSPITATKPWMVTPGNHEANCNNGGTKDKNAKITYDESYCLEGQTEFKWYREHFRMPADLSGGRENFWYSYNYGMTHFVSLTSETDLGGNLTGPIEAKPYNLETGNVNGPFGSYPNEQVDFLVRDLRHVDRSKTPWVVVFLHRPWYCSSGCEPGRAWQQAFEKIFYENNVDFVFHGHVHNYERFSPLYNGTVDTNGLNNPRAPLYILSGNAGHYDGLDSFDSSNRSIGSAFSNDNTYGWGRLTFIDSEHAQYEQVASANSTVVDTATLYKKRTGNGKKGKNSSRKRLQ